MTVTFRSMQCMLNVSLYILASVLHNMMHAHCFQTVPYISGYW